MEPIDPQVVEVAVELVLYNVIQLNFAKNEDICTFFFLIWTN